MFKDLLGILKFYIGFEIDDFTGAMLDNNQIKQIHTRCARAPSALQSDPHSSLRKLIAFQRVAFKYFSDDLRSLALCNLGPGPC